VIVAIYKIRMKIIVDTGIFISLFVHEDINNKRVVDKYTQYQEKNTLFFISDYILDELFTRLRYDCGEYVTKIKVAQINRMIKQEELILLSIDDKLFNKAQEIFLKFSEHKLSFTDATTYCLYKTLKLNEIFTLDSDFRKIGAKTSF
jgi:predicted nucleic acid-binding protein